LLPLAAAAVATGAALGGAVVTAALACTVALALALLTFVESGAACGVMTAALAETLSCTSELVVETRHAVREARPPAALWPQAAPSEVQS
jgi:hypothetical protein